MPPINQAAFASAGVIAISVAVAAAIAVYESPELQRMAQDLRRRIAVALHSLGDEINPNQLNRNGQPIFNRPEDAEGFLESRGGKEAGVEADEESRRRQREELMYWNALKEKKELERMNSEKVTEDRPRSGSNFDDFMQQDKTGEKGTFVFNTGADANNGEGLVRRRGATEGVRGLNSSLYANPFADEHGIDYEELEASAISPDKDDVVSESTDIYGATEKDASTSHTLSPAPQSPPTLVDVDTPVPSNPFAEEELAENEYMTAGQEQSADAYASIQAWAQSSNPSFYSPLPTTPAGPRSEISDPEVISAGQLTPTDSASVAGSGVDVVHDDSASQVGENGRYYDVISEDEDDGMATPVSWSEVGSVVSESEDGGRNGPVAA